MRLQSLKIKGFKSFADETTLHFRDDLIAIVGPNGSGKSNIVDAIRWVLGEQKGKDLRLDQMTDVLFNGTKKRKESALASVTISFDNADKALAYDYQTVSISRLLYRSGESEYRINDVPCRLKDIKSLLIDTGISSDSYAIISLGMVDDILSDKDHSRRKMLEQAAGISRYKQRKKETLSKLNQTDADLERIKDLLFEIESNLKSLEKQAQRAKSYNEIREKYKQDSILYASMQYYALKDKSDLIEKQIVDKQDQFNAVSASILKLEAELSAMKLKYVEQESLVSEAQRELGKVISAIRQSESEKQLSLQKINFLTQSLNTTKTNIHNQTALKNQLQQGIFADRDRVKAETDIFNGLKVSFEALKQAYQKANEDFEQTKSMANQRQIQLQEIQKSIFEQDKELAIIQSRINSIKSDIQRTNANIQRESIELSNHKSALLAIEGLVNNRKKEYEVLLQAEANRKKSISDLDAKLDKTREQLTEINRTLDAKENEYDLLKSMIDSYEGFPESIRFLHAEWKKNVPILSDLIEVEEKYRTAIELYLDNWLNYFVVDALEEASSAINLLKNAQKGKANFFILNVIEEESRPAKTYPDGIAAISVVKFPPKYRKLMALLFRNVFIYTGSLDNLKNSSFQDDDVIISESGLFMKMKNSLTGGSVGLFEGKKIGRRKSLEILEKSIQKNKEKQNVLMGLIENIKGERSYLEKQGYQIKIEEAKREIIAQEQEKLKLNIKYDNLHQKIHHAQLQVDEWNSEILILVEKENEIKSTKERLSNELEILMSNSYNNADSIDQLSRTLGEIRERYNQENIKLIRQQNLLETITRDLDYKENRLREIIASLKEATSKEEQFKLELDIEQKKLSQLDQDLLQLSGKQQSVKTGLGANEQHYFQLRNDISEREEKLRQETRHSNQLQLEINNLRDQLADLRFKINSVKERLSIEFGLSLDDFLVAKIEEKVDPVELDERLQKYRSRLQNFGEVNPLALDAYNEIRERYDLIKNQEKDILEAKNTLINTIKEIENTATNKFLEAFNQIRENFIHVFRSLFTEEDNCDLVLISPNDPLESDVEIIAKPKGKKPKSLSQLSGGEKTLTAIALLFALYLLKPAPFCIFDEVDAPLDDANIEKFNKIIKKFSKDSQFIIVTHNKVTMAAVDTLYGVYMQEQGVTAVTQVDFRSIGNETTLESVV